MVNVLFKRTVIECFGGVDDAIFCMRGNGTRGGRIVQGGGDGSGGQAQVLCDGLEGYSIFDVRAGLLSRRRHLLNPLGIFQNWDMGNGVPKRESAFCEVRPASRKP
jgi:hypothetical protein